MIGRKSGTEKELNAILARRERAGADATEAAAKEVVVQVATESRLQALALSDASAEGYAQGQMDAVAELQRASADRHRCDAIYAALSVEADRCRPCSRRSRSSR